MLNECNSSKDSFPTGISSFGLCYGSKDVIASLCLQQRGGYYGEA